MKQYLNPILLCILLIVLTVIYFIDSFYFELLSLNFVIPISFLAFLYKLYKNDLARKSQHLFFILPAIFYVFFTKSVGDTVTSTLLSLVIFVPTSLAYFLLIKKFLTEKISAITALISSSILFVLYQYKDAKSIFEFNSDLILISYLALVFFGFSLYYLANKSTKLLLAISISLGFVYLIYNESFIPEINKESWQAYAHKVGDESCMSCHSDIVEEYKLSEMGRSMDEMDSLHLELSIDNAYVFDEKNDLHYRIKKKNKNYVMTETRYKEGEKLVEHELEFKIDYIVGSGANTKSFLMNHNGYIFEMPITWYSAKKKWDLSPGYENYNLRFYRQANQKCMDCHTQETEFVEFSENKYESVHMGIDCEECHGPASLHLEQENGEREFSFKAIANPARQADINLACYKCHEKENLNPLDKAAKLEFTAHATRLSLSKCFIESDNLNCMTCHDPHMPLAETRTQIEESCFTCHSSEDIVKIPKHDIKSDCISCHMPRDGTSDIPHVTSTDHWIRVHGEDNNRVMDVLLSKYEGYFTPKSPSKWQKDKAKRLLANYKTKIGAIDEPKNDLYKVQRLLKDQIFLSDEEKFTLALSHYYLKNFSLARKQLFLLLESEFFKENPELNYFIGKSYSSEKNYTKAIEYQEKALAIASYYIPSLLDISFSYLELKDANNAIKFTKKILAEQAFHEKALYRLAYIKTFIGTFTNEEKYEAYKDLFRYYPDHHDGIMNYAHVNLTEGRNKESLNLLRHGAKKHPKSVQMLANYARVLLLNNKADEARIVIKEIEKTSPKNPFIKTLKEMLNQRLNSAS